MKTTFELCALDIVIKVYQ